jgi:tRNA(Ile)-lysidine synthase
MTHRRVAVAVSGGRDSMALLHCVVASARAQGVEVWALHVHHGLVPEANEWARFVERSARARGVRFAMQRLAGRPIKGESIEAWARSGRYAALTDMAHHAGCAVVLLAHHRGDQAETFLLQSLRGAGPAGLASMPVRAERGGIVWLRPWLEQPRAAIEVYVRRHRIRFVDDASNGDRRFARNRLRRDVMPALLAAFPDAEAALAAAARQAARARTLIAETAAADLRSVAESQALDIAAWGALPSARQREALRAWLTPHATHGVAETLLDRLIDELPGTSPARWPLDGDAVLARYRGTLSVESLRTQPMLRLVKSADHGGVPLGLLAGARWRARRGAEQFQRSPTTPPRSLKKQFQAAGVPAWARDAPLLYAADGALLFVPGLGTDARALARPGTPRVSLEWERDG